MKCEILRTIAAQDPWLTKRLIKDLSYQGLKFLPREFTAKQRLYSCPSGGKQIVRGGTCRLRESSLCDMPGLLQEGTLP